MRSVISGFQLLVTLPSSNFSVHFHALDHLDLLIADLNRVPIRRESYCSFVVIKMLSCQRVKYFYGRKKMFGPVKIMAVFGIQFPLK
jgi:hypothetical protein